jgi:hypothetical protein
VISLAGLLVDRAFVASIGRLVPWQAEVSD